MNCVDEMSQRVYWLDLVFNIFFSAITQPDFIPAAQNGSVKTELDFQLIFYAYNRFDLGISTVVPANTH